uniref:NADH dehydrogenase subunit 6 n=1 Tax=Stenochironomus gibbus TaxID=1051997 RepID=UPI001FAF3707|nr:NADH dehydrogenase subunit 6 [Stenochironomus gibbus]UKO32978.1 NADH dehydrogenase subunit 6 [Stenochironomus gibbus]
MTQKMFFFFLLISSFTFIFLNHPLAMNTNLMIQALLTSFFAGLLIKTFWFSYSLFLIFLGGILILFLYMTMVASNEKFFLISNFKSKHLIIIFFCIWIISLYFLLNNDMFLWNETSNFETMKFMENLIFIWNSNSSMLYKIYNFPMNLLSIILIMYLFVTMIAIVKISKSQSGPYRQ